MKIRYWTNSIRKVKIDRCTYEWSGHVIVFSGWQWVGLSVVMFNFKFVSSKKKKKIIKFRSEKLVKALYWMRHERLGLKTSGFNGSTNISSKFNPITPIQTLSNGNTLNIFLIGCEFWQIYRWITLSLYTIHSCRISMWSNINNHIIKQLLKFKFLSFKIMHKIWVYESNDK